MWQENENDEQKQNEQNLNTTNETSGSKRGFASMDEERRREIASQGGTAAHVKGTAHEFSSDEAREAGRKGGQARAQNQQNNTEDLSPMESNELDMEGKE